MKDGKLDQKKKMWVWTSCDNVWKLWSYNVMVYWGVERNEKRWNEREKGIGRELLLVQTSPDTNFT